MLAAARKIRLGEVASERSSTRITTFFIAGALAALLLCGPHIHAAPQQGSAATAGGGPARVIELRIGDEVEPIMAEYVDAGIEQAARENARLILITMDTPGGLEDSMKEIIQHITDYNYSDILRLLDREYPSNKYPREYQH